MRRMSHAQKHTWLPRLGIVTIVVLGPFFVFPALQQGNYLFAMVAVVALVFIGYVNATKVRVCESCGHVAQPENLLVAASFCPKCGAALRASKLFGHSDR